MIFTYNEFLTKLNSKIKTGEDFCLELLETVIKNPNRYCGLFRLSNAKTKLIQNVTQSKEIKFGDFMEDIVTDYISKLGYENKNKEIGCDENGDRLNADQVFEKDNIYYLVEQKIRDDHDSTKKRGQYANFDKKVKLIRKNNPQIHIVAIMWFIDDGLIKNKNYYQQEMFNNPYDNVEFHLYYGSEFFNFLNNGNSAWNEIVTYLKRNRMENSNEIFSIPDFGESEEIYNALLKLDNRYWKKLNSTDEKYNLLREELFSSGENLKKVMKIRK